VKILIWIVILAIGLIGFSSCNDTATNTNADNVNANANAEKAKSETEMKSAVVAREKSAHEAVKNKDGKFFEAFLADGFVGVGRNGRGGKDRVPKAITESKCETKSFSISDEEVTLLGEGVALMTAKITEEIVCDGKETPSPLWTASVYVKNGDNWNAIYHQTRAASDAKGEYPKPAADAPKPAPIEDADKDLTATLSGVEKGLWEAWTKKDTKPFEEALAENYREVLTAGPANRGEAIKEVGGHKCEIKSYSLDDLHTMKISENLYLLSNKVTIDGTCDGKPVPKTSWVSTIFSKDGDKWKELFHMTTPAA